MTAPATRHVRSTGIGGAPRVSDLVAARLAAALSLLFAALTVVSQRPSDMLLAAAATGLALSAAVMLLHRHGADTRTRR